MIKIDFPRIGVDGISRTEAQILTWLVHSITGEKYKGYDSQIIKDLKYKYSHPSDDIDNVLRRIKDKKIKIIKYILLKIKDNLTLLITMKPSYIEYFIKKNKKKIFRYFSLDVDIIDSNGNLTNKKLGNIILICLRYAVYRESLLLRLADFLNIRSCPYCNAAYTLYIEGKEDKYDENNILSKCNIRRAMFQFDHYFPKEKFPIFSISFYNLIPSCTCCNQKKSETEVVYPIKFNPHIGSVSEYFYFKMDEGPSLSLWKGKIPEKFELKMVANNSADQSAIDKYNRQYNIVLQYNRFTHEVYELYKNEYSHKHYKDILDKIPDKDLQTLFIAKDTMDSIERTPLSKLKSDIKKQIKEDNIL